MPHDKKGQVLKAGDKVILSGKIKSVDSDQPTYCNITFVSDNGMEPNQDIANGGTGSSMSFSARMVEKVESEHDVPLVGVERHIVLNKQFRRHIDRTIQLLKEDDGRKSRERSIAITKLQEAVMWLGMDLKDINDSNPGASPNPYPNSKDPSNTKIEPTADGLKL